MFDIIGLISITLVTLITILITFRFPAISRILFAALIIRFLFLLINNHLFYLPDGDMDAKSFEWLAWKFSQDGLENIYSNYITSDGGPGAYFISFMIAIPYSLLGRSALLAQSLSILFGIGSVFLGWLIAKKLWNEKIAIKVGWTIALFPTLVSYSVLTMREVYITFFLLLAIYGIVKWFRDSEFKSILIVFFGFIGASVFHGASAIGLIIFLIIVISISLKNTLKLLLSGRINPKTLIIIIIFSSILSLYFTNKVSIPYLETFNNIDLNFLKEVTNLKIKGDASYPELTKVNSNIEFIYKIPIKAVYFLFSPFPWEIKKLSHMIGLVDSFLYIILTYLIFCNRKEIWEDPAMKVILLILLSYFIVFGLGVGNFGSGIRHRSKFVIEMILLAAPLIPNFVFINNKKLMK